MARYFILPIQIHMSVHQPLDDIQPVLLGRVVKRGLPVQVALVQVEPPLQQEIQALLLPVAADVEQNGLLKVVLEVGIGAVVDEELHDFVRLLVVDEAGGEVEGGLSRLGFEPVDDNGVVVVEVVLDFVHIAEWWGKYQHLMAMMKLLMAS